jgi:hypothetical protein
MAVYKNDYTKEEDMALWTLHEIRHKMARRTVRPDVINRSAKELIQKRRLSNLKFFKNGGK